MSLYLGYFRKDKIFNLLLKLSKTKVWKQKKKGGGLQK